MSCRKKRERPTIFVVIQILSSHAVTYLTVIITEALLSLQRLAVSLLHSLGRGCILKRGWK